MSRKIVFLLVLCLALLPSVQVLAGAVQEKPGSVCWPMNFAGIVLGVTNDSQVKRLLGPGRFYSKEGDTGGRYFVDKDRRATLHVVMYTDGVVGELTVSQGIDPALKGGGQGTPESLLFDPSESFGNWHALHLGSSKAEVLKNLGVPETKNNDDEWVYSTSCACEIPQHFTLFFRSERIFKIVFSAPAG